MITVIRTDSANSDLEKLIPLLDSELAAADGDDHPFFAQFNKLDMINNIVIAYEGDVAVGCGAFKNYANEIAEIKRMFVLPEYRGKGIGEMMLEEIEAWAKELGYTKAILETGKTQESAIALYKKKNYKQISNYAPYIGVEKSYCMRKVL